MYIYSRFSAVYIPLIYFNAVGYSPGDSSSTRRDFSILRLSTEVPFGIKAAVKPCSDKCKSERKPFELALSFGFSEAVGRLSIGFGTTSYELAALSRKLYSGGWEGRYVCLFIQRSQAMILGGRNTPRYGLYVDMCRGYRLLNRISVLPRWHCVPAVILSEVT